jgi:hypothetical protein
MLLRMGILAAALWFTVTQLSPLASSAAPQVVAGCAWPCWPCGGVTTAFSPGGGGGNAQAVLGALPTPAEAIHLPRLLAGAEAQIRSALP